MPEHDPVLFAHGPLPRLRSDPERARIWHISAEFPVKGWPTSADDFGEPLP
jgi:hypothetical protein